MKKSTKKAAAGVVVRKTKNGANTPPVKKK